MMQMMIVPHFPQHVTTSFLNSFPSPYPLLQKYDLLMCSAPAVDFDCSGLYDPRHLLNAVAHAAAHSGCLHTRTHAFLQVSCSHSVLSCRLPQKHQHEPQLVDINHHSRASAAPATLSRPSAREHVRQPFPWHCRCLIHCIVA